MVKIKNAQVGQGQNPEGGTSRGKGKGKRVPSGTGASAVRASERFISVKEATRFEEWTRNRRKIASGHRVDLHDMQGMEAIPYLFEIIGWIPLLIVNELYYVDMIYEFYANLYKGRIERVDNVPHQWIVTRIGGRDIAFDDRLLNEILDTPQDKHMLATQSSSTKCLSYGCFITKILQHFVINLVGIGDHIGHGKIYTQQTFKRMGFEKDEDGTLIRGGQDDDENNEENDDEDQEDMDMEEEDPSLQTSINTRFDAFDGRFEVLDGKVSNIQERLDALDQKMTDTQERVNRLEQGGGDRDD
ncbi:hypothetical protein M9H77_36344 [Catharanthus roseus]|uniref:Uncharacterized protein n=1 Tax=Catharanthus roseus TaxID=4058 RepID=A0ACB9ZTC4_CATRO|nr:hypothetical protein M9H77_36344 [Catharanthus roseus]